MFIISDLRIASREGRYRDGYKFTKNPKNKPQHHYNRALPTTTISKILMAMVEGVKPIWPIPRPHNLLRPDKANLIKITHKVLTA